MPTFDIAAFRLQFPQFASATMYPDALLMAWWTMANCALQEPPCLCLDDACGTQMLYLMTAHIGTLMTRAASGGSAGGASGVLTSATIDKVTVDYSLPPFKDGWEFWMASTPYGVMLWGLLSSYAAGGFSVNGRPEQEAFRGVYGGFY